MTCTILQTAKAQLHANPQTRILAPWVTHARRNTQYGSILCYHHGRHVITLNEGTVIWRGGFRQINHNRIARLELT